MGLVCRVVEQSGIATVCLATGRDLVRQVRPPRTVFVNFPMGNAFGKPNDRAMQTAILRACLELAEGCTAPGEHVDLPYAWPEPFAFNPNASKM